MILDSPDKVNQRKTSGRKQILYVEDDRSSQFLVEQILRDYYDVDVAPHAKDVMTWVTMKEYDLILMDIKLDHGYSGIDLTKEIRCLPKYNTVPILAVTAVAFPDELNFIRQQGLDDIITKPINFKLFKRKIADLLTQAEHVDKSSGYY